MPTISNIGRIHQLLYSTLSLRHAIPIVPEIDGKNMPIVLSDSGNEASDMIGQSTTHWCWAISLFIDKIPYDFDSD